MDNRARILETALALFARRGYDAIGVQEICESAGITKPTLYHYFGSKRGLLETLIQERGAAFLRQLAEAAAYNGDLPLTLQRIVETYFAFADRESLLCRLSLSLWFADPANEAFEVIVAFNEHQHQLVEEMFRAAASDHGNMQGRHRMYAATFVGMIATHLGMALNGYMRLNDEVARDAVRQFSYGIYT